MRRLPVWLSTVRFAPLFLKSKQGHSWGGRQFVKEYATICRSGHTEGVARAFLSEKVVMTTDRQGGKGWNARNQRAEKGTKKGFKCHEAFEALLYRQPYRPLIMSMGSLVSSLIRTTSIPLAFISLAMRSCAFASPFASPRASPRASPIASPFCSAAFMVER